MICLGMNRALMHIADIFFSPDMKYPFLNFLIIHDFFFLHVNGGMYYTDPVYYSPLYWFIPCRSNEDNFNLLECDSRFPLI